MGLYECKIRERTLFDCRDLISSLKAGYYFFSDADAIPKEEYAYGIKLCKVKIDVRSTINPSAAATEMIEGWTSLGKFLSLDAALRLDRLSQIFMNEYLPKIESYPSEYFCLIEPDILDALRLAYWYHICERIDKKDTFQHKKKEIRNKLRRGLLTNIEKFKTSYDARKNPEILDELDNVPDAGTVKRVESLPKLKEALPNNNETKLMYDRFMYQWFKEFSSVIAELRFAALSGEAGFEVSFEPSGGTHDFDFLINNIPIQVKANVIYRGDKARQRRYIEEIKNTPASSNVNKLSGQIIVNQIIEYIKSDYLSQIKKSLEQKTKMIIVDGTQSSVGYKLNKWSSENNKHHFSFKNSLIDAFNLNAKNTNFIPLIFSAGAIDYKYRFSSICLRIPIIGTDIIKLDESNLSLISSISKEI